MMTIRQLRLLQKYSAPALFLAGMFFAVSLAHSQPDYGLSILPAAPSPIDEITITVQSACPRAWEDVVFDRTHISLVNYEPTPAPGAPCSTNLPYQKEFLLKALTAGSYTVDLYFRLPDDSLFLELTREFEVSSTLTYSVNEGTAIERCGGFSGGCDFVGLKGQIRMQFDTESGEAMIVASDLLAGSIDDPTFPFPAVGDLALTDLLGTIDEGTINFTQPSDTRQTVRLTLTPVDEGFILNGSYDQGCCDRYRFDFENVLLKRPVQVENSFTLGDGRFDIKISWTDFGTLNGSATGVGLSEESAWFWFFSPTNAELLIKVLDGCDIYGHFWVFAAGLTNVGVEITIEDTKTGNVRTYSNPVGTEFQPILDTTAFATCTD